MLSSIDFNIGFTSSIYTVSEDNSFVDLTIVKTPISDAISTTENITVLFNTKDGTAQGKWHASLHNSRECSYWQ